MNRNEGDIRFIPRSTVVALMRANYQDPVGFHEAMCAQLDIEEEEYAFEGTLRGRWEALKQDVGPSANEELEPDVLRRAIRLAQTIGLSGDEEFIDETTPWFEANGLPTPRARAADAREGA
ncbi:MAG TPA: hypothetical protein VF147_03075 [Vicinamibacterales bacterium]